MSLTNLNTYGVFPYSLTNLQTINTSDGGSLPVSAVDPLQVTLTSSNQQLSLYESSPDLINFNTFDKSLQVKNLIAASGTFQYAQVTTGSFNSINAVDIYASRSIYSNLSANFPNAQVSVYGIEANLNGISSRGNFTGPAIYCNTGIFGLGLSTQNLTVNGTATINSISITGANIPNLTVTNITGTNAYFTNISGTNLTSTNITGTNGYIANLRCITITGTNAQFTNLTSTTVTGTNAQFINLQSTTQTGTNAYLTNISNSMFTGTTVTANTYKFNNTLWSHISSAIDRINWQYNNTNYMTLENQSSGLVTVQNGFFKNNVAINDQVGFSWTDTSYAFDSRAGPCRIANGTSDKLALLDIGSTGPFSARQGYLYADGTNNIIFINQAPGILYLGTNNVANLYFASDGRLLQSNVSSNSNFAAYFINAGSSNAYGLIVDYQDTAYGIAVRDRSNYYRNLLGGDGSFNLGYYTTYPNYILTSKSWGQATMPYRFAAGYYSYAEPTTQQGIVGWITKQNADTTNPQPYLKLGSYEYRAGGKWYNLVGAGYANQQFDTNSPLLFGGYSSTDSGRTTCNFVAMTRNVTSDTMASERFRVNSANNGGTTIFCLPQSSYVGWTGSNAIDGVANIGADGLKIIYPNSPPTGFESTTNAHALSISNAISSPSQVLNMGCTTGYAYMQSLGNSNYNTWIQPVMSDQSYLNMVCKGNSVTGSAAGLAFRQTYLYPRETSTVITYSQKGIGATKSTCSLQGVWIYGTLYYSTQYFSSANNQDVVCTGTQRSQFCQVNSNTPSPTFTNIDVPVAGLYRFSATIWGDMAINFGFTSAEMVFKLSVNGTIITRSQNTFIAGKASLSVNTMYLMEAGDTFALFIDLGTGYFGANGCEWSCELVQ